MYFAPRVHRRLRAAVERADDGRRSYAEICRMVGRYAAGTGLAQPSYERVRTLARLGREATPRPRRTWVLRLRIEASIGPRSGLRLGLELGGTRQEPP